MKLVARSHFTALRRALRHFARLALLATILLATNAVTASAVASATGSWTAGQPALPLAAAGTLYDISCPALASCVAVGHAYAKTGQEVPLAEAWDGTAWSVLSTPVPAGSTYALLYGVSCSSTHSCVAVGWYCVSLQGCSGAGNQLTLAEAWDGTAWSIESTPNPPAASSPLLDAVSCYSATVCTAVGSSLPTGASATSALAETWNGKAWSLDAVPDPTGKMSTYLSGISCRSPSFCMATGDGSNRPLAELFNGRKWTIERTPAPTGSYEQLSAISCESANSCTAVGSYRSHPHFYTLLEYWNGKSWSIEAGSANIAGTAPDSLSCISPTACMAVGYVDTDQVTLAEYWNGTTWTQERTVKTENTNRHLSAVSCVTVDSCIAVGTYVNYGNSNLVTLAEFWNGTAWTLSRTPNAGTAVPSQLTAVSCPSASFCLAAGTYASTHDFLAEVWDGHRWSVVPTPLSANGLLQADHPYAISCASTHFCMVVGLGVGIGAFAAAWDGTTWTLDPAPAVPGSNESWLTGISCTSTSFCMATYGSADDVVTWNGSVWGALESPPLPVWKTDTPNGEPHGVSCVSATACTVVGAYRSLHTPGSMFADSWNGTSWSTETAPVVTQTYQQESAAAVSCTSSAACTAVGVHNLHGGGEITLGASWNGTAWSIGGSSVAAGDPGSLNSVSCVSATACEAFGDAGAENWNGSTWTPESLQPAAGATGVHMASVSCVAATASCTAVGYTTYGLSNVDVPLVETAA